jgi:hypothetical protein
MAAAYLLKQGMDDDPGDGDFFKELKRTGGIGGTWY